MRPPLTPPPLAARDPGLHYRDDFDVAWHPAQPDFAIAANAVSMLMPHAEPYVTKAVRAVAPELEPDLRRQAEGYIAQETAHHREHHRFNKLLIAEYPSLQRVDGWARRSYRWLWSTRSERFHLAFAAGFETVAYAAARWTARRSGSLFRGADPEGARLFQWHLAEEVEHKTIAYDVYFARHESRFALSAAMWVAAIMLAWFSVLGTLSMLWSTRRIFNPLAHLRLLLWTVSFTFELLPAMVSAGAPGHHPAALADPTYFQQWLRELDAPTATEPAAEDITPLQSVGARSFGAADRSGQ